MIDPTIQFSVALLLIFVFGGAVVHKLGHFRQHARTVADYRVVPDPLVSTAAFAIVAAEMLVCFLLGLPTLRQIGFIAALGLIGIYIAAISINLARGHRALRCGCGTSSESMTISGWLVLRNGVLLLLIGMAMLPAVDRQIGIADWTIVVLQAVSLFVIYLLGDLLISNALRLQQLRLS